MRPSGSGVDDDGFSGGAVDEGADAEVEVSLRARYRCPEIGVGVTNADR
jgi:hypothetical protein